jgi:hypothetical protein
MKSRKISRKKFVIWDLLFKKRVKNDFPIERLNAIKCENGCHVMSCKCLVWNSLGCLECLYCMAPGGFSFFYWHDRLICERYLLFFSVGIFMKWSDWYQTLNQKSRNSWGKGVGFSTIFPPNPLSVPMPGCGWKGRMKKGRIIKKKKSKLVFCAEITDQMQRLKQKGLFWSVS